jgi:hypothetical protein
VTNTQTDLLPKALWDKARKLARHEIGHWVISRRHGFVAGDVTAKVAYNSHEGGSAIILMENVASLHDLSAYLERRIQVCWAGVLAEALGGGNTNVRVNIDEACRLLEGSSAQVDRKVARELLQCLRNIKWECLDGDHANQLDTLAKDLWARTIDVVQEDADMICGVAGLLFNKLNEVKLGDVAVLTASEIEGLPIIQEWVRRHGLRSISKILSSKHRTELIINE